MPRPRPTRAKLEYYRGIYCIVWWDGDLRRRTSCGTDDIIKAQAELADFNVNGRDIARVGARHGSDS